MSNSDHSRIGAFFQKQVMKWFHDKYGIEFELEKKIPIGEPPMDHKFDIASEDGRIVIECKRYTWTKTGNVPSAKLRSVNEAALFLSFLENVEEKYIVMLKTHHPNKSESLAEYYYRTNGHLLRGTKVAEFDPKEKEFRIVR